jgi:hypothetical protein
MFGLVLSATAAPDGSLAVLPVPDLSRSAWDLAAVLRAPILEDVASISDPGRVVLAVYNMCAPRSYGRLPAVTGAVFIDVSGVS